MQEAKATKKDIRWINYARAICIILIYYMHAEEYFEFYVPGLAKYIAPVYVNAFFFVSGYLLFKKFLPLIGSTNFHEHGKQFFKNILFRLIIPTLIFSVIEFIPNSIFQSRDITIQWFVEKTIWGHTYWFISALVVAEIILFLLFLTKIKNIWFYFFSGIGLFSIGLICFNNNFILVNIFESNPWHFDAGLVSILFLVIGGIYWKYEKEIDRYLSKPIIIICGLFVYLLALFLFDHNIKVLVSMNRVNILGVIISTIGIIILVFLCKYIRKSNKATNLLNSIGQNTIGFYFVCGAIPKALTIIMPKFLPKANLPYMLLGFFASFILACIVVSIITHFLPFLFDIRVGIKRPQKMLNSEKSNNSGH
ncbi:acyltransferase [Clostridiales bacterium]|nr:acyltransferase [Clostridiales bacterium]